MYQSLIVLGIVTYLLMMMSFLSGMRIIKLPYKYHKIIGIVGLCSASVHGLGLLYLNFFTN